MKKVIILILISMMLFVSCTPKLRTLKSGTVATVKNEKTVCADVSKMTKIDGYTPVSYNEKYELHFDTKLTNILLKDKISGMVWTSIPDNWDKDAIAKGSQKNNIASNLILECYDDEMQPKLISSYTASVKKKSFTYTIENGSLTVVYQMNKTLYVSLTVYLTPNGMEVNIPIVSITDTAEIKIHQVTVLPFFGAVKPPAEGYLLVPDGSGALVDVKKSDARYPVFTSKLYGWDNGLYLPRDDTPSDSLTMPIFGSKSDNQAFLGVIKQREFMSQISVSSGKTGSEYFSIAPIMIYRDFHTIVLFKGTLRERIIYDLTKEISPTDFRVEYRILTNNDANYVGMAQEYQEYLLENGLIKKNENEPYLDLTVVGAIRVKDSFAGVPMQRVKPLTTFFQAEDMLKKLNQSGVISIHLNYKGANKNGYMYNIDTKFVPEPLLGGKKEFNKLLKYTKENDMKFSLVSEALSTEGFADGFKKSQDATRYFSNYFSMLNTTNPVNFKADKNFKSRYIITPHKVPEAAKKFLETTENVNVTINDIGSMIYSDFKKDRNVLRQQTGEIWSQLLADLSDENSYFPIYGANAYTYPYATNLLNVPNYASNQDFETRKIPFMQIALHAYIPYSHKPINLEANYEKAILSILEYGSMPSFELIHSGSDWLQRSRHHSLVSCDSDVWLDRVIELYQEIEPILKKTANKEITDYYLVREGVYCTEYGESVKVFVNYNDGAVIVNGTQIGGLGYIMTE